jgi:hypothetical protein
VLTRTNQSLVVSGQSHRNEAYGDGTGFCCFGAGSCVSFLYSLLALKTVEIKEKMRQEWGRSSIPFLAIVEY